MKKNLFFHKAIFAIIVALPFPAIGSAQWDRDNSNGSVTTIEQLDKFMNEYGDKLKYIAPHEEVGAQSGYALELLEQFAAKAEKQLVYNAPDDSYELYDNPKQAENFFAAGYLTNVSTFDLFILNLH